MLRPAPKSAHPLPIYRGMKHLQCNCAWGIASGDALVMPLSHWDFTREGRNVWHCICTYSVRKHVRMTPGSNRTRNLLTTYSYRVCHQNSLKSWQKSEVVQTAHNKTIFSCELCKLIGLQVHQLFNSCHTSACRKSGQQPARGIVSSADPAYQTLMVNGGFQKANQAVQLAAILLTGGDPHI